MEDQEKDIKEQAIENEDQPSEEEHAEKQKDTTEKIWDSTKHVWNTATFKANQYKKLVQKKIDIAALHKKISGVHSDLGKMIDDLRTAGKKNIMNLSEVRELLAKLDEFKSEAAKLEEEVEQIKHEEPPKEDTDETMQS